VKKRRGTRDDGGRRRVRIRKKGRNLLDLIGERKPLREGGRRGTVALCREESGKLPKKGNPQRWPRAYYEELGVEKERKKRLQSKEKEEPMTYRLRGESLEKREPGQVLYMETTLAKKKGGRHGEGDSPPFRRGGGGITCMGEATRRKDVSL